MEWIMRFLAFLELILIKILQPIFWYRDRRLPAVIPADRNLLLRMSACELAKKIRNGEIMSETVVKSYIERIREVNPVVNAVVDDRFEEALNEAKLCDKRLQSGEVTKAHLEIKMPLYGVPFTVKESCSLKGLSHTGCTLSRQGIKATADSPIVESMKNAGAIGLCVTNTPELSFGLDSANLLYGKTCNPYDSRRIAGGSSGGEAALLGSGASLIGIGSDIAGSIRVPALFNGVYGHKPTPGIIPITGHFPMTDDKAFHKYLVLGPMARYMEDLSMAMRIMSGEKGKLLRLDETVDMKKLRVFYKEEVDKSFGIEGVDWSIKQSIKRAATYLKTCVGEVKEASLGSMTDFLEIMVSMLFRMKNSPNLIVDPADPKHKGNAVIELAKAFMGLSGYTKAAIYLQLIKDADGFVPRSSQNHYNEKGEKLRAKFIELLGDDGVFLFPSFVCPAPPRGQIFFQPTAGMYALLSNVFGFPATQVPMGLTKEGLPIGFQIIAGPNQDRLCLAVARELEKRFGGWIAPTVVNFLDEVKETTK